MKKISLKWNTVFYGVAAFIDRLIGFFLLPLLTKKLTPEDYGAWSQIGVAAGLLVIFVLYAFPTVIVKRYADKSKEKIRLLAFKKIGFFCLSIGFFIFFFGYTNSSLFSILAFGDKEYRYLIPSLLFLMFAEANIEFSIAWLRVLSRFGIVSLIVIFRSLIRFLLAVFFIYYVGAKFSEWIFLYASGIFLFSASVFLFCFFILKRKEKLLEESIVYLNIKNDISEATPLVFLSILTLLAVTLDRYFLASFLDLDVVARYTAAASLAAIPFMIHNILGFTIFPEMSKFWNSSNSKIKSLNLMSSSILIYAFLSFPVVFGLMIFGADFLLSLTTSDYIVSDFVFFAFAVSAISLGFQQIMIYAILLAGKSFLILRFTVATFIVNLFLLYVLVPFFGIFGAALAAAVSNSILMLITIRYLHKSLAWNFPVRKVFLIFCKTFLFALPSIFILMNSYYSWKWVMVLYIFSFSIYFYTDMKSKKSILGTIL